MLIEAYDHIICKALLPGRRKLRTVAGKVYHVDEQDVFLTVDARFADQRTDLDVQVTVADVLANLGPTPALGTVYGCKVEPYIARSEHPFWGAIYHYRKLSAEELELVEDQLAYCHQQLERLELTLGYKADLELRRQAGKLLGMWHQRGAGRRHLMQLYSNDFTEKPIVGTVYHEYGHRLWGGVLTDREKAVFVRMHAEAMKLITNSLEYMESFRKRLVQCRSIATAAASYVQNKQSYDDFQRILKWIRDYHNLRNDHIDLLLQDGHDLQRYWPIQPILLSDSKVILTSYANTNPEEFWCELFRLHVESDGQLRLGEHQWMVKQLCEVLENLRPAKLRTQRMHGHLSRYVHVLHG